MITMVVVMTLIVGALGAVIFRGDFGYPFTGSSFMFGCACFFAFMFGVMSVGKPDAVERLSFAAIVTAPFFLGSLVAFGLEQLFPYRWQSPQWKIQNEAERENYERDQLKRLSEKYPD